jgi:hypothetical protein
VRKNREGGEIMTTLETIVDFLNLIRKKGGSDFAGWHAFKAFEMGETLTDMRRVVSEEPSRVREIIRDALLKVHKGRGEDSLKNLAAFVDETSNLILHGRKEL